jgi:hypothetical protein
MDLSAIVAQLEANADSLIDRQARIAGIDNPQAKVVLTPAQAVAFFEALSSPEMLNSQLTTLAQQAGFNLVPQG